MRVISGKYKGAKLISPSGQVRPTTDLVKGSLFSILANAGLPAGAECLDVFCGSGGLGIEALSRGARSCVFIDRDTANVDANLKKLGIGARSVRSDFRRAVRLLRSQRFDLVFCDPPYKTDYAEQTYMLLDKYGMLKPGGVAVLEHSSDVELQAIPKDRIIDTRTFGACAFSIVRGVNDGNICGNV